MISLIRKATFAGRFYPGNSSSLKTLIDQIISLEEEKIEMSLSNNMIIGGIVPHAGYYYSGYQAVHFYKLIKNSLQVFDTVVIINPNHTGIGSGMFNSNNYDFWDTPFGKFETDSVFTEALNIEVYNGAHDNEHSGEVQLPLLNYLYSPSVKIVLITMNQQNTESASILAQKIYNAVNSTGKKVLLIASSDFTHYESPDEGFKKDQFVVDAILDLNSERVYSEVKKHNVTACGYGTIMTLINYSKLKSTNPEISILKRGHSGEVHPSNEVVDYISFLCFEKYRD